MSRLTPKGRPRQNLTTPRSAFSFRGITRNRDASHTPSPLATDPSRPRVRPQHYMPNQGLFEREDVYALMSQSDDDDNYGEGTSRSDLSFGPHPERITRDTNLSSQSQQTRTSIDFVALFQEQLAMLKTIVTQQESMKEQQQQLIRNYELLEEKIAHLEKVSTSNSSNTSSKHRTKVPRQLTVSDLELIIIVIVTVNASDTFVYLLAFECVSMAYLLDLTNRTLFLRYTMH